jgi:Pyridoxamine 5'-phosphate oxidase
MEDAAHAYTPPDITQPKAIPAEVSHLLDGSDLLEKTQALRLSTIDAGGWPHASLLSAGDMLAMPDGRIRFVIFAQSATAANLARDGRVTMTLALDGGICELRMKARRLSHGSSGGPLAFFEASLEETRIHKSPYADVTSGVTFALHKPNEVLPRWRRQIAAMREAA